MRTLDWSGRVGAIAAAALVAAPAAASAATRSDAQVRAAIRTYVAAVRGHDAPRICRLVVLERYETRAACVKRVGYERTTPRAVKVDAVAVRGNHARAALAYGVVSTNDRVYARARLELVRTAGGRWLVAASGKLPGASSGYSEAFPDPRPTGTRAALARLTDDEMLGLSGEPSLVCAVLAPGAAPLRSASRCTTAVSLAVHGGISPARWGVLRRIALSDGGRSARLTATVVTRTIAHVDTRRHTFTLKTITRPETLFARRDAHRAWRLIKPSRTFYAALGVPAPDDIDASTPAATWPTPDAGLPSLSENPMPAACATPVLLWSSRACRSIGDLAGAATAGGGLVAWSDGSGIRVRPVAGGGAAGGAVGLPASPGPYADRDVYDGGLLPVSGGTLLVEQGEDEHGWGARATPLDAAGHPDGSAQILAGPYENGDDAVDLSGVVTAPGATTTAVLVDGRILERLTAAGARAARDVDLVGDRETSIEGRLALLPDGSLVQAEGGFDGMAVHHFGADGREIGPVQGIPAARETLHATSDTPGLAVDAAGRVLVLWREDDQRRELLRAWVYDPAAPSANAPVDVGWVQSPPIAQRDRSDTGERTLAVAGALPGGGWGVAYGEDPGLPAPTRLWAGRLAPGGAVASAPRMVGSGYARTDYGAGVVLAGDTVAWIAPPQIAGLPQVRSAPLP